MVERGQPDRREIPGVARQMVRDFMRKHPEATDTEIVIAIAPNLRFHLDPVAAVRRATRIERALRGLETLHE